MFSFLDRHVGPNKEEIAEMLKLVKADSLDQLIAETIPAGILRKDELEVPPAMSEYEYLRMLKEIASKNKVFRSYIGRGYYGTVTPSPIARNIFQNPGWYTQYTPYQAEIAQGRLEALLNFQTMVSDLTGMPIANASLLDEATAAAEAMSMFYAVKNKRSKTNEFNTIFVDDSVFKQTADVIITRALPLGINVIRGDWKTVDLPESTFSVCVQFPNANGEVEDYQDWFGELNEKNIFVTVAADLLSLSLFTPPGEMGAHAVVGTTQRFGVPIGYGGPHAAYFATLEKYKRAIPGRIIGVSVDAQGDYALRMALQTREQHIKREKATSNICTAQALLAIMAGMYAVYHGKEGIQSIAQTIRQHTANLAASLSASGWDVRNSQFFDTITISASKEQITEVKTKALESGINLFYSEDSIAISLDETVLEQDVIDLIACFGVDAVVESKINDSKLDRTSGYLEHHIFNVHKSETSLMRYIKSLENKDLSLMHSMIALGSCTMKLNAASELMPVSWPEFADIHPFAPVDQVDGYTQIINELEDYLCNITGFTGCSLQPNSGAQGEYAGLLTIRSYHQANGDDHRNKILIPVSAHGTNPASAVMAGMQVVLVACDEMGNIDVDELKAKATEHKENLAGLMVTYPSTHGVFEEAIKEICDTIHDNGGLVYMDGANMNAQVGYTSPGHIHADVCHLNLHKTFAIPHGGGGPGMGPICVNDKLKPFLPTHYTTGETNHTGTVSAAAYGSASILLISYGYIRMLGAEGLKMSTTLAILNANYMKARLEKEYSVLYTGEKGRAAHELIVDLREFKALDISAEDVAKRLIDYGFHAPTLSFPVAGTLMIEPTESENKEELDKFCDALLEIKKEINELATGEMDPVNNVLHNAPHSLKVATLDEWPYPYSRSKAIYPLDYLRENGKFWSYVGRVNNAQGDRNLVCTCPPIEAYA